MRDRRKGALFGMAREIRDNADTPQVRYLKDLMKR
jgi:hypothetical protein